MRLWRGERHDVVERRLIIMSQVRSAPSHWNLNLSVCCVGLSVEYALFESNRFESIGQTKIIILMMVRRQIHGTAPTRKDLARRRVV
jgi:hypothetical protein